MKGILDSSAWGARVLACGLVEMPKLKDTDDTALKPKFDCSEWF